jgi:inward rectifier potassium channel
MPKGSFADAFFFSVETLATVGYGAMSPATTSGHLVATIEIFVGMMFTTTMTGLAFVRLSKPKAKIIFADKMVVTRQGDVPVLMARFGNGRAYALTDAKVRIVVLLVEIAEDGQEYRRPVDLKLRRQELIFFPAMWTAMHDLDEASPLHGITQENVGGKGLRIMLNLVARDPQLGAEVHALQTYDGSDIAFGMRYAEAVSWDSTHSSVADMRKISSIEAEMPPGPATSGSSVAPS